MKIECENNKMLVLELSGNDLQQLDVTYKEMCVSKAALDCVVKKLLETGMLASHRVKECKINAFPDADGGCMMFLDFGYDNTVSVFETDDVSAMLDCVSALKNGKISRCELYSCNNTYRLVLHAEKPCCLAAYEFMHYAGDFSVSEQTRLSWSPLCTDNFIDIFQQGSLRTES